MDNHIKIEPEFLLASRKSSEEQIRLHQVKERLQRRLALVFRTESALPSDSKQIIPPPDAIYHAEKFNHIFTLWQDLQCAMAETRQDGTESLTVPWNNQHECVSQLWEQITRPENMPALMEWHYQSASGEIEIWAQQALQECRLRSEQNPRMQL